MHVTVDVAGEGTYEVDLESLTSDGDGTGGDTSGDDESDGDASDGDTSGNDASGSDPPTYADLVGAIEYSPHEVSVLVDGRLVPEDQPVEADSVTVLRLIKGG